MTQMRDDFCARAFLEWCVILDGKRCRSLSIFFRLFAPSLPLHPSHVSWLTQLLVSKVTSQDLAFLWVGVDSCSTLLSEICVCKLSSGREGCLGIDCLTLLFLSFLVYDFGLRNRFSLGRPAGMT